MEDGSTMPRNTSEEICEHPAKSLVDGLMVGSDNTIAVQEVQGQVDLTKGTSLPVKMGGARPTLESFGFKFGAHDGKDQFIAVEMPAGWKVVPTDHPSWWRLLDDKARERGHIFYKVASSDRDAYMTLAPRFSLRKKYDHGNAIALEVRDGDEVIHSISLPPPLPESAGREELIARYAEESAIYECALAWLKEHYPDHEDAAAYRD